MVALDVVQGEKFGIAVSCEELVVRESGPQFDMRAYFVGPKDMLRYISSKTTFKKNILFVALAKQPLLNVPVHHTMALTQSVATNILKNLIKNIRRCHNSQDTLHHKSDYGFLASLPLAETAPN